MHPFEDTPQYQSIQSHYAALKNLPAKIRETELPALEAIMNNPNFDSIANTFEAIEEYFGCELTTTDKPLIALKLMEIDENRQDDNQLMAKLQAGIERLQAIIGSLDEQNTLICEKTKWLSDQIQKYEASLPDLQQQIEIILSQNQKMKSKPKGNTKRANLNNQAQLLSLLSFYRCTDKSFPKNKTEALMLVNRIQAMIQQLQMKKLSNYL